MAGLQNVMRVDNGNIIGAGGGSENSVEIDWADWILLTPEEQETGDWTIVNCPWADGDVSVDLMTKLWENPSPTSSFPAQNVTLSDDDYDYLIVLGKYNNNATAANIPSAIGRNGYLNFCDYGTATKSLYRKFTVNANDATKVEFTNCILNGAQDNTYLIPTVIYGIKLTASVKINAVAMDVKASVEYSTSEHLIGKWIDGSDLYEKTIDFGALPNNTIKKASSGLSNITIRKMEGVGIGTGANVGGAISIPYYEASSYASLEYTPNNEIRIKSNIDVSLYNGYVTLRYTKNS